MTTTKSNEIQHDDLTVIKGIGEATQRWLREELKVFRLKDLAALSVDEIEAALRG